MGASSRVTVHRDDGGRGKSVRSRDRCMPSWRRTSALPVATVRSSRLGGEPAIRVGSGGLRRRAFFDCGDVLPRRSGSRRRTRSLTLVERTATAPPFAPPAHAAGESGEYTLNVSAGQIEC